MAALKMAAVILLVLFAGQLLMAASAAAECTRDHDRTCLDTCCTCLRYYDMQCQESKARDQVVSR